MKRFYAWSFALTLGVAALGCAPQPATAPSKVESAPAASSSAPAAEKQSAPTPAATPTPEPAAQSEGAAGSAAPAASAESTTAAAKAPGLMGSTWKVGEFVVTFQNDKEVLIKGGKAATVAPNGLVATYKVDKGMIEVSAMGKTYAGTWDGSNLVVDGQVGARQ